MDPRLQLNEVRQTWTPPEELKRCRPREVRLTGAGKALRILALVMFLAGQAAGVILYVKASTDLEDRRQLLARGIDTEAQVVRRWQTHGEHPSYHVEYVYRVEDETLRSRVDVGRGSWGRLAEGSILPIRYLPENPRLHLVHRYEGQLLPIWVPFLVAGALAATALLIAREIRRQRLLLAEGRPTPAVVTRHQGGHQGKIVHYAFLLMSGAITHGKAGPQKNPPPIGSILCALYEPDRLRHNGLYPLSLVRPRLMVWTPMKESGRRGHPPTPQSPQKPAVEVEEE